MCSFICSLIECSLNGECSCPSKKMGARAPKIMGARAPKNNGCAHPFFQESIFMNSFLSCSFLQLFTRSPSDCSLNNECSCPSGKWVLEPSKRWVLVEPSKRWVLVEPPKIMGARPHFFKRAFHELISFMSILQLLTCSLLVYL